MNKIVGAVGKRVAEGHAQQYEPADALYESYTDAKGRQRRRKRAVPENLSKRDAQVLRKVRKRAHYLDKGINLCGFRIGYTFFLALIPFAGDIATFGLNYKMVIKQAHKCDLPATLKQRMLLNALVASGMALVPLLGDIAMAAYKPNTRNAHLLEEFLIKRAGSPAAAGSALENQAAEQTIQEAKRWGFSKKTGDALSSATPSASTSVAPPRKPSISQFMAPDGPNVRCTICEKIFKNEDYAVKHLQNKHPTQFASTRGPVSMPGSLDIDATRGAAAAGSSAVPSPEVRTGAGYGAISR